jgi:hypothetical protein
LFFFSCLSFVPFCFLFLIDDTDLAAAKQRLINEIEELPTPEQLLADQDSASKKLEQLQRGIGKK